MVSELDVWVVCSRVMIDVWTFRGFWTRV